jgi:ABC-type branched-subunit amino acid transport system substrate-binding protein
VLNPWLAAASAACVVLISFVPASAEEGVTADAVAFGQVAPLAGPAAALGQGMRLGIQAAFDEANRKGGVHGRVLKLTSRDDGYEPNRSIVETRKLIDEDKVFALIGAVGTPTTKATQPIATAANIPFIGPFTGAAFLRDPKLTNVVNFRAGYDRETEAWVAHLTGDLKLKRIAILYQDDAFGRSGFDGVKAALNKRGLELAAEDTYERNTTAVKTALLTLKRAEPEAVVMVGAYKPCAQFIKLAHKIDFHPVFVNISFVGASALARELGEDGKDVIVSQVVPFPWDANLPVVADYQAALKAEDPKASPEFVSLEGYLVGRLAVAALEKAGPEPTREGLLKAVRDAGKLDLGGLVLNFTENHAGLDQVFLTVIQGDGSFKAVENPTM